MKPVYEWVRGRLSKPDLEPNPPPKEKEPIANLNVKFHLLESHEDLEPAIADFQSGWNLLFVDIRPIKGRQLYLKTAVDRLNRVTKKSGGRLSAYGNGWLVMSPKDVEFMKMMPTPLS